MGVTYFKRYRMEIDLSAPLFEPGYMPTNFSLTPWHESLTLAHGEAKFQSFRFEIDANVFPCLGNRDGCRRLMAEIARRPGFLPEATWLLECQETGSDANEFCGTIQGIRDKSGLGAIQNLGITPPHRGLGLGTYMLRHALDGFRQVGLRRAFLEVTAQNSGAVRLYQKLGFRTVRTVYKAAEVAFA